MISNHIPKLCLNMIVKNESKIIERLFNSVYKIIDSYCICDTGSTDGTPQIIENYFKSKNISGRVIQEPFRDFGYNRTYSLSACENQVNADYILLMDADMILEYGPNFDGDAFKKGLCCADAHYIFQGSPTMSYKNVRIVKNNIGIKYWGVTHEVISTPHGAVYSGIQRDLLFINDVGDGGAKADKYVRDIRLLLRGLEEKPNNDRYTFYLANSYRENGEKQKAIETYKKRIEIGGWIEEIWQSYYNIGKCYQALGEHEKAIANWLEGYDKFPERLENIYEIMTYYRKESRNRLVYELYKMVKPRLDMTRGKPLDHLFVQNDVYDYKIDYEYTISGFYCNPDKMDIAALCMKVLETPSVEHHVIENIMSNYKFYVTKISNSNSAMNYYEDKPVIPEFTNSTPTLCFLDGGKKLLIIIRYVNYKIDEKGNYINKEKIETVNIAALHDVKTRTIENEFIVKHNREYDNLYVGLEDMRIIEHNGMVYFTANRGLENGEMAIEFGTIGIEKDKPNTESIIITKQSDMKKIEKNWTLYEDAGGKLKTVYGWYPLTVYELDGLDPQKIKKNILQQCNELPPFFKNLRGSCNGIIVGNETWFLCHSVSYEDRRYYYHIIVALDRETEKVVRWTKYFTLEGQAVEYVLGFQYDMENSEFIIGYSTMDRTTQFVCIQNDYIEKLFV